jgi:beta-lactamase regulating signal transducer with metallopeptidase domain
VTVLDTGLLLSLPTESIAFRVVIASVAAVLLARLLLRAGLRVPRVRAVTALVPSIALVAVLAIFWAEMALPALWVPVDAVDALPVPVRDTYLTFAPMAAPLMLGLWVGVASARIGVRTARLVLTYRRTRRRFHAGRAVPNHVHRTVARVARRMRVSIPPVAMVDDLSGGATVVGLRRPVLVIDGGLVAALDGQELEGVVAHELAHVRRHDNLMALAVGVVRDLFWFVPGGRWASRLLHAERELAADSLAVDITRRPAALASGLLKVIEGGRPDVACAALMPRGSLVARVEHLIDDREPVGRMRSSAELLAVSLVVTLAVAAAAEVPVAVSGAGQREALALLWTAVPTAAEEVPADDVPDRAFSLYRSTSIDTSTDPVRRIALIDDEPDMVRPEVLWACGEEGVGCPVEGQELWSLGLRPKPVVRIDQNLVDRWHVEPVVSTAEDGLSVFWFERLD